MVLENSASARATHACSADLSQNLQFSFDLTAMKTPTHARIVT